MAPKTRSNTTERKKGTSFTGDPNPYSLLSQRSSHSRSPTPTRSPISPQPPESPLPPCPATYPPILSPSTPASSYNTNPPVEYPLVAAVIMIRPVASSLRILSSKVSSSRT
ncbi:hypothetical protein K469DRAFT_299501 [Zopfia rhizophila CBS 207.26]|uniref:Uncharacterized protein n=1 Tax=Zopfia rhizophila CBS 207.26 TaxID=1314779 RepID=A0A6A6DJE8_9PEZI|nr:hypothetical protein K469DRAFT_299501 [Zopfia rhizophila CBS 207.26]